MENFIYHIIMPGLLLGGVFLIVGALMYYFPPRKPNFFYGYRTASSMKSQPRWEFAQKFSAIKLMEGGATIMALSTVLGYVVSPNATDAIVIVLLMGVSARLFITTERALSKKFSQKAA